MPKTTKAGKPKQSELPSTLQNSGGKAQRTFTKAYDAAIGQYGDEQRAHQVAYAALKHTHERVGDSGRRRARGRRARPTPRPRVVETPTGPPRGASMRTPRSSTSTTWPSSCRSRAGPRCRSRSWSRRCRRPTTARRRSRWDKKRRRRRGRRSRNEAGAGPDRLTTRPSCGKSAGPAQRQRMGNGTVRHRAEQAAGGALELEPVRRLQEDDVGPEPIGRHPPAADGQRRCARVAVGDLPALGADRRGQLAVGGHQGQHPTLVGAIEADTREPLRALRLDAGDGRCAAVPRRGIEGLGIPLDRDQLRVLEPLGQRGVRGVGRSRFGSRCADRRQHVRPDGIEDALHVRCVGGGRDDQVLVRQHDAELAVRPVAAVAVPGLPELEAVALPPVRIRFVRVGDVRPASPRPPSPRSAAAGRPSGRAADTADPGGRWPRWWRGSRRSRCRVRAGTGSSRTARSRVARTTEAAGTR